MSYIAILGRQPELSIAELEALGGKITRIWADFVELDDFDLNLCRRLGGTVKLMKLLTPLPSSSWHDIRDYIVKTVPDHVKYVPEGKLTIGLSAYNLGVSKQELGSASLSVKKAIKNTGRSVRLVANTGTVMSSAQVLHNNLTGPRGWEIVALRDGQKALLCQTVWEQDIIAYTKRDQARPKRDARVGMLPPKLAQIILNLAAGKGVGYRVEGLANTDSTLNPKPPTLTVLDPFCGTGVVLQEALLMGFTAYGTDSEQRMIDYSKENLGWLSERFRTTDEYRLELGDATRYTWRPPITAVATETTLGKPMSGNPKMQDVQTEMHSVQQVLKPFLKNLAIQIKPGTSCCFAVPAWFMGDKVYKLPLIDQIEELGYTLSSFKHVRADRLIYRRPDQIVGRQLLSVTRK